MTTFAGGSRVGSTRTSRAGSTARTIVKRRDKPYKTEHQRVLAKKRKLDLHVRTVPYVPGTKRLYVAPSIRLPEVTVLWWTTVSEDTNLSTHRLRLPGRLLATRSYQLERLSWLSGVRSYPDRDVLQSMWSM